MQLNRNKLRQARRREGRYLLRTNLYGQEPAQLWQFYIQLTEIEAAFKNLKDDLACARSITNWNSASKPTSSSPSWPTVFTSRCAPGSSLWPAASPRRAVLDKFAAIQMLDVHFPTTDGRTLILSRYTELNTDQKLLVAHLNLNLPPQPPPRITAAGQLAPSPQHAM